MSVVRKTRFLVLLVLPLLVLNASCVRTAAPSDQGPKATVTSTEFARKGPCSDVMGSPFKAGPIICVDDTATSLSVTPDTIEVWDSVPNQPNTPVMLQWFTSSGTGDLRIVPSDPAKCPLKDSKAAVPGHYWLQTIPGQTTEGCKYTVFVGTRQKDPTIVITPCCGP